MRLSLTEYLTLQARRKVKPDADCESESTLQEAIHNYCKQRQWIVYRSRMDKSTRNTVGQPDFIIQSERGRTFFVECKSKTGKLTPEQKGLKDWASRLGHMIYLVRTFDEFIAIVHSNHPLHD